MIKSTLFLFAAIVVIANGHPMHDAFKECKDEFDVTREEMTGDNPSEKVMCFSECIMKKSGFMDAEGNFVVEKMKEVAEKRAKTEEHRAAHEESMNKCLEQVNAANPTGQCEKGYQFSKCINSEMSSRVPHGSHNRQHHHHHHQ